MPHCSFDLHFSNNQPYGASFHALDGKKPFFTGKKIKNEWQLPECLGSISPHTRYSSCTWLWLWPQKTEGNQRPMKSSNVAIMRKLETSPFGFESWSFSLIMAASWKSVFNSYQPFTVRQSDSNLNLYSTLGQLVSKSSPDPGNASPGFCYPREHLLTDDFRKSVNRASRCFPLRRAAWRYLFYAGFH